MLEQIGLSILSNIKRQIKINLLTTVKTDLFYKRNTYGEWGEEKRHFFTNAKLRIFWRLRFSQEFFGYFQLQINAKTIFYALCMLLKILWGWGLKAFISQKKVENLFLGVNFFKWLFHFQLQTSVKIIFS